MPPELSELCAAAGFLVAAVLVSLRAFVVADHNFWRAVAAEERRLGLPQELRATCKGASK